MTSLAYWKYVLFSAQGIRSVLAVFGGIYLLIQALDFFGIYTEDKYATWGFILILGVSIFLAILTRRPVSSILVRLPSQDTCIEVRIGNIFDSEGAVMISTNTSFESDVAGGKISPNSLQGQFTARYYTGNQDELIEQINSQLENSSLPVAMGTTIPISTHGKTFYFTAMAKLNDAGNAKTTAHELKEALDGLWLHVKNTGELQQLAIPLVGTGRGRVGLTRKKIIRLIVESFSEASKSGPITDHLLISIRPEDARRFNVNLYDIKDYLNSVLNG